MRAAAWLCLAYQSCPCTFIYRHGKLSADPCFYSKSVEPLRSVPQEPDEDRTSSVYSQHSPHIPQEPLEQAPSTVEDPQNSAPDMHQRPSSLYSAVSPLHTPRASEDLNSYDNPEVSPIEATPPMPQIQKQHSEPKSQLPVPRKPMPETGVKSTEKKKDTKWDDYSGEPTTSENGKEAAVKPGMQPVEMQYPDLKAKTRQILAGLRERGTANQQVARKVPPPAQTDPLDDPPQREPWKGPSGRTTLVKPVKNNPAARLEPIQIPANNNNRRVEPAMSNTGRVVTPSLSTIKTVPSEPTEDVVKPPAPLRVGKNSPSVRTPVTADPPQSLPNPLRSPRYPDTVHASVTLPTSNSGLSAGPNSGPLTPLTPTPPRPVVPPPRSDSRQELAPTNSSSHVPPPRLDSRQELAPTNSSSQLATAQPQPRTDSLQPMNMRNANDDPSSRFSWTTYATTVADSPPDTPRGDAKPPPVPHLPTDVPTPLVMRKRPVEGHAQVRPQTSPTTTNSPTVPNAKVVVRKPTPADRRRASTILTTASDLSKSLPQCPPEMEAPDKISSLEARMEEFALRKRNITKLIKQLSSGVQPSAIAFDVRAREEMKRTIKGLESELAEIIQEEHDVGLRLHRVQRRRDRDEMYENPTGLWIKRVTTYNG